MEALMSLIWKDVQVATYHKLHTTQYKQKRISFLPTSNIQITILQLLPKNTVMHFVRTDWPHRITS